ncbi:YheO-like PAS domain-containing protein [Christiangramia gaetbulicola]|uniref:YheO-like PAS domain-containing protein n=1 Tax=Christiangramia gaetbulicola TaxID=703340 RepID=A0A2T6AI70_9FLAO|nr:PAS domain-containing protein [Christiangramia gaetbulicola]PTX43515.1 YheO-like PAS domain-containing protein [Christiangramia gaetbulicola]
MIDSPWLVNILSGLIVSLILFTFGYLIGKRREKNRLKGKNIEEYDFYPFDLDEEKRLYFDLKDFRLGIYYFLKNRDYSAARQLILLGEQNEVRHKLNSNDLKQYQKLYKKYEGDSIFSDNSEFLENYKRIVRLIGDSFPDLGIEILLHDLSNPAKSLCAIENNITGRKIESGATNLVLDLKTRKMQSLDKLNYELNIGARKFKCTTIPIFRKDLGLVAAICINVDVNYLQEKVMADLKYVEEFFRIFCKTEMQLNENILSKDEYRLALEGKRHWQDRTI